MPKLKTHSGAKKRFKMSKNGRLSVHMQISHTFLPRKQQNVKEVFVRPA